jgi:hypothetical protein
MTDQPTELFRLTIEAVGHTRESAINHAIALCYGSLMFDDFSDRSTGSVKIGASARWETIKTTLEDTL